MTNRILSVLLSHSWHYLLPSAQAPGKSCGLVTSKCLSLPDWLLRVTVSVAVFLVYPFSPPSTSVHPQERGAGYGGGGVTARWIPSFSNPGNSLLALFLKSFFFPHIVSFQTLQNVFGVNFLSVLYNSLTPPPPPPLPSPFSVILSCFLTLLFGVDSSGVLCVSPQSCACWESYG